jgi:transaldolase
VIEKDRIAIDPTYADWAGIAAFKKARRIFVERKFRSTLLAAAYRHEKHWSALVGEGVILSIPYTWWTKFEGSEVAPRRTLEEPVSPGIVEALYEKIPDFRRAYDERGLSPEEFATYGASVHTLRQFLSGYQQLVELVRDRMLP